MKFGININRDRKKKPLKFMGNILAASLLVFGAASCNEAGERAYEEEAVALDNEYGYTTEPLANTEAEVNYFEDWDTDDNRVWNKDEFVAGIGDTQIYEEWDTSNDNLVSEGELEEGLFDTWDEDGDGYLDHGELTAGYSAVGTDYTGDFSTWDTDRNSLLSDEEFTNGLSGDDFYSEWDEDNDGVFSDTELYSGLYNSWDMDDDGYLAYNEYNEIGFDNWVE